jgi:hypothetical protein
VGAVSLDNLCCANYRVGGLEAIRAQGAMVGIVRVKRAGITTIVYGSSSGYVKS